MKLDTYLIPLLGVALLYLVAYATVALLAGAPLLALSFGALAAALSVWIVRRLARNGFPRLAAYLFDQLVTRVASRRPPDFIVGANDPEGAYLRRWFLSPWRHQQTRLRKKAEAAPTRWNRTLARLAGYLPNLYLHQFLRDDDDRALHDHPSWAASLILHGGYVEHTIAAGGIHHRERIDAGRLRFLPTTHAHRVELVKAGSGEATAWARAGVRHGLLSADHPCPCWTLFLFGPTVRDWGFHCPLRGWVHWKQFTAEGKPGEVGPGCDA